MRMRFLGRTGLQVSAISFGAMTFGGASSEFFRPVGTTELDEARRQVDLCLDAGVNLFDTADVYSDGRSEEILGAALGARRADVLVATKLHGAMGGPNDRGQSRHHIVRAVHASLRRLGTDWIDVLQVHAIDGLTDPQETLRALDDLVRAGTVRYTGCSNHSAWHLMRALGVSEREHLERYSVLQAHYSLVSRELEHELVPLCLDQGVGILVWSPLAGGFLTGKVRRGERGPEGSRQSVMGPPGGLADEDRAFDVVDALVEIGAAHGVSAAQVALNWLSGRPGVSSLIVGARTEEQLADNLAATGWDLTDAEAARLEELSALRLPYPYWHQLRYNAERLDEPWIVERRARG
ncbi:aldo/keto reductase [Miltoncostaea oceani]|uniref:aldo/keto reductase n=1 Tax=Miltoncostaea oceani TaxID=2843216 RepID=UPI003CCEDCE4